MPAGAARQAQLKDGGEYGSKPKEEWEMVSLRRWALLCLVVGLVWVLAACGGSPSGEVSLDDAIQLVLKEVVQSGDPDHQLIVFALPEPLQPGDVIHPYQFPGLEPFPEPRIVAQEEYFFWVDDTPGAQFAHPNRFVFVDRASGEISVSEEAWWPVLNEVGLWIEREEYWDEDNWIYSNFEYRPIDVPKSGAIGRHASLRPVRLTDGEGIGSAIVINGWIDGQNLEEDLATDADGMHDSLTAAGFDTTYLGPPEDDNPDRNGDADLDGINTWFRNKKDELEAGDTLFVYITSHGTEGIIGPLTDSFLRRRLEEFDPGVNVIIVLQGCYSGSFVDPLLDHVNLIITATNAEKPAFADIDLLYVDTNYADVGSEFSSGYIEDWNNIMNDPSAKERLKERAQQEGKKFINLVAEESTVSAKDLDLAYSLGWEIPQVEIGNRPGAEIETLPQIPLPMVTNTPTPTLEQDAAGEYQVGISVKEDKSKHKEFVKMLEELILNVVIPQFSIEGPAPWVTVSGELAPDGTFSAWGTGTVAGFKDIEVTFEGMIGGGKLYGDYTMGAAGGLPTGAPIIYWVDGAKVMPTPESPPESYLESVDAFLAEFGEAMVTHDIGFLLDSLHPAVIDLYGQPACEQYLDATADPSFEIEVFKIGPLEPWIWEMDGVSTPIDGAHKVDAQLSQSGQTNDVSLHVAPVDDGLRWFTDCGDPLP
jgi:hypothetical protein